MTRADESSRCLADGCTRAGRWRDLPEGDGRVVLCPLHAALLATTPYDISLGPAGERLTFKPLNQADN